MAPPPAKKTDPAMARCASQLAMDDDVANLQRGSRVWYRADVSTWQLAELRERAPGGTATLALLDSGGGGGGSSARSGASELDGVPASKLVPANPDVQAAIPDLTQLTYLNEPSILGNLGTRYGGDEIYTNAGPVLIAVNPCRELPLYTPEVARSYRAAATEALHALPPHVYVVAGAAYRAMVREGSSQSIVINGESGAGKTETTKKAMQFFAQLAGGTSGVELQVLDTNPILEAFGNAKTLRNANSSRFGKLIEIHFNAGHHICGARIRTYLLEKSRVVRQLPGERSYHVFYQLVRGASRDERAALRLPAAPADFTFLSASGCDSIDGVDDAAEFRAVCEALADVGIAASQQAELWRLLSGVLWLGNLSIEAVARDDSSRVVGDAALANASELLGVDAAALGAALTTKRITAGAGEAITKRLTAAEAADARDALAKALYAGAFDWVVARVNDRLDSSKRGGNKGATIAILDIYGFEQFTTNGFEQLCINYANERLQQQFTRHLFTLEQEEYAAEGIDWTKVEWVDNQACLDVIEAMPPRGLGVLAVLDSQCRFPRADDATLVVALKDALEGVNDHFGTHPRRQDEFVLQHYAGPVSYCVAGFLDKNKDTLSADLIDVVAASDRALPASVGAALAEAAEGQRRGGATVSSRFTSQLRELIAMLDATGLHFVRCIKPNAALSPFDFHAELVLQQLRCCGVLEVARVSRAGYPTRYAHKLFVQRYKILLPPEQQAAWGGSGDGKAARAGNDHDAAAADAGAVRQLLAAFRVDVSQYEVGRTKVFFRPGVLGAIEDRWAAMQAAVLRLQAGARMWLCKRRYASLRAAALFAQAGWRARGVRAAYTQLRDEHRAALAIQRAYRGHAARASFRRARASAVTIQMAARRRAFDRRVGARAAARAAADAAARSEAEERRRQEEGFEMLKLRHGVTKLDDVKDALALYASMRDAVGRTTPDELAAALEARGLITGVLGRGAGERELVEAAALAGAARSALGKDADAERVTRELALAAAARGALGKAADAEHVKRELALAAAAREAGDAAGVREALAIAAAARAGGAASASDVRDACALASAAREGGAQAPAALGASLELADAARLAGASDAAALRRALALADAARGAGVSDSGALRDALALAAAPRGLSSEEAAEVDEARSIADAVRGAGIAGPRHLAAALAVYAAVAQRAGGAPPPGADDGTAAAAAAAHVRAARRALSMHAAADDLGLGEKRDFVSAARLYAVLKAARLTGPVELSAAAAMFAALREEGIEDPRELQAAVATHLAARDARGGRAADAAEVRAALLAYRGSGEPAAAAFANGHSSGSGGGGGPAAEAELSQLRRQLEASERARARYADKLEEQALEWMEQVRVLKEHLDSLRVSRANAAAAAAAAPAARGGGGFGAAAARNSGGGGAAAAAVHALASDLDGKAPLFDDDAAFIQEVADGAPAPGMDAGAELEALRKKHEAWNRAFKERLLEAGAALKKQQAADKADKATALKSGGGGGGKAVAGTAGGGGVRGIDLTSIPDLAAPGLLDDPNAPPEGGIGTTWATGDEPLGNGGGGGGGGGASAGGAGGKKRGGLLRGLLG